MSGLYREPGVPEPDLPPGYGRCGKCRCPMHPATNVRIRYVNGAPKTVCIPCAEKR